MLIIKHSNNKRLKFLEKKKYIQNRLREGLLSKPHTINDIKNRRHNSHEINNIRKINKKNNNKIHKCLVKQWKKRHNNNNLGGGSYIITPLK